MHDLTDEHLEQSYDTAELSGYFHDFSGANIFVASGDQHGLSVGSNAEWLKTDNTTEIQEITAAETSLVLANGDLFRVGRGGTAPFNGVETPIRNFGIDEWEPYLVLEGNNVPSNMGLTQLLFVLTFRPAIQMDILQVDLVSQKFLNLQIRY